MAGQDGGDVTHPRIGRRRQVVLQGGRGRKAAQGDVVQVGAVVRAEGVVFGKLKQFRAVATRYDKRDFMYQATVDVASIRIGLRDPIP